MTIKPSIRGGNRKRNILGGKEFTNAPFAPGNNGHTIMLDITDCVSNCGDHGQGTHSGNENWRRDCFKSCVDTVLANRAL